jgi:hypothetical protein
MTTPEPQPATPTASWPTELGGLTAVSSIVDAVSDHVSDLTPVSAHDLPRWLRRLALPPDWHRVDLSGHPPPPTRIAVYGQRSDGGWDGCETISVFRFTGTLPANVVHDNVDYTLRDLHADNICTVALPTPSEPGVTAARSDGYFTAGGRRIWARYSIYVAGTNTPGQGMLVHQGVFVEVRRRREPYRRAELWNDIEQLGNAIHIPFLMPHPRKYQIPDPKYEPPDP